MKKITERQKKVLNFIERYQMKNGGSPTVREIREYLGVASDFGVVKHLRALEKKGFLCKDSSARGVKMLDKVRERLEAAQNILTIPVLGTIPAGGPVEAQSEVLDTFAIGEGMMRATENSFLLRVTGQSMIDAGIHESDLVLVDPNARVRHGDIVVALVDGENTVKRYMSEKGRIYLKAENPEYEDIYPQGELRVQGVVSGLVRSY